MGSKKTRKRESRSTEQDDATESSPIQRSSRETGTRSSGTAMGSQGARNDPIGASSVHDPHPDAVYGTAPTPTPEFGNPGLAPSPSEHNIQRAFEGTGTSRDDVPETVLEVLGESGTRLEQPIQRALEERMDADFSNVRIHTGAKAAEAADAIDAKAFTCGNDIVFNSGEYEPESAEGQFLLDHELTHVRQQTGAAISMMPREGADLEVDPDPQLEREADEAAKDALSDDGPLVVNRLGTDIHVQRSVKGALSTVGSKISGIGDDEKSENVEFQELDDGDLAETVGTLVENQQQIMNQLEPHQGWVDKAGEATSKGAVGGTVSYTVSAVTANPVLGAIVGGMASDLGKTLYGEIYDTGKDAIANADVPDVGLDQLGNLKNSITDIIEQKLDERFDRSVFGGDHDALDW